MSDSLASILRQWFGVSPSAGRLIAALLKAGGQPVPLWDLCDIAGQTRNGTQLNIKFLRAAMDPDSLVYTPGEGYGLTAAGLADCRRGIADADARAA